MDLNSAARNWSSGPEYDTGALIEINEARLHGILLDATQRGDRGLPAHALSENPGRRAIGRKNAEPRSGKSELGRGMWTVPGLVGLAILAQVAADAVDLLDLHVDVRILGTLALRPGADLED